MSKKIKKIEKVIITPKNEINIIKPQNYTFVINDLQALFITIIIATISYIFSFYYTSFYQGEEGAQYMNALGFWKFPNSILGNWPKTGWKVIYAPIVLLGKQGVLIANCLFSAFSAFFAYKLASKIIKKKTALPLILLATQTLWFLLSFKFFSEILTAFILVLAIYFLYSKKYILFSLFLSYILILRQEFVFIIPYFAFLLIKNKKWFALFCLGVFPILYNLWGWQFTGDWLYSLHESQRTAAEYQKSYPKQGFDHYFIMSGLIFNIVVTTLAVTYIAQAVTKQLQKIEFSILIPTIGFILIHCLFNFQAYPVLTSTGGNLRYLLVISPLMAVLAAKAVDNMQFIKNKNIILIVLIPFLLFVMAKMTYYHNWVIMDKDNPHRDFIPFILCAIVIICLLFIKSNSLKTKIIAGLSLLTCLIYIRPKQLCCDENYTQKQIADYIIENKLDKKPILQNLSLFNYFYGKNNWDFPAGNTGMNGDSTINNASIGSIIIWDTHYAKKYGKVDETYFNKYYFKFKQLKQFRSDDEQFAAVIFEKISN